MDPTNRQSHPVRHQGAVAAALLLLGLGSCRPAPGSDGFVDRHRAVVAAERIVVCVSSAPARAYLEPRLAALAGDVSFELTASLGASPDAPRVVFAGPETPGIGPLLSAAGIEPRDAGFLFDDTLYGFGAGQEPSDAIALTLADPDRPGLPLNLAYARNELEAARIVGDPRPAARLGFRTWRKGTIERSGPFTPQGAIDLVNVDALAEERARALAGSVRMQFRGFALRVPGDRDRAAWRDHLTDQPWLRDLVQARERAGALLATVAEGELDEAIVLTLYTDLAVKAAATGNWQCAWSNPVDHGVHLMLTPDGAGEPGAAWALSAGRNELGPPVSAWLAEGFAIDSSGRWWGRELGPWQARLAGVLEAGGVELDRAAALALEGGRRSPHLIGPLRALLYRVVLDLRGADFVRGLWRGAKTFALDDEINARFEAELNALVAEHREELERERQRSITALSAPVRKGVHVEPERFGEADVQLGHGSPGVRASLTQAQSLGLDSITVSAYRYLDVGPPTYWGQAHGPSSPTPDAALWRTLEIANELGLRTSLRSHSLRGPSTTWNTWMPLAGLEAWAAEFEHLERIVEHHALFAELAGCELLCIAGGLRNATDSDRDRPGRRELDLPICDLKLARWQRIIAVARQAFDGGLTYAADGIPELLNVEFWDQLDYVAVDLYEPLGDPADPARRLGRRALERRFAVALERLAFQGARVGKPVLVTELGFPSASESRFDPTWVRGGTAPDEQAELLRAVARAVTDERDAPLAGMWLWRWSTDPSVGGGSDRSWLLARKPAEAAIVELSRALQ